MAYVYGDTVDARSSDDLLVPVLQVRSESSSSPANRYYQQPCVPLGVYACRPDDRFVPDSRCVTSLCDMQLGQYFGCPRLVALAEALLAHGLHPSDHGRAPLLDHMIHRSCNI